MNIIDSSIELEVNVSGIQMRIRWHKILLSMYSFELDVIYSFRTLYFALQQHTEYFIIE
jgi:hypothetical protein